MQKNIKNISNFAFFRNVKISKNFLKNYKKDDGH